MNWSNYISATTTLSESSVWFLVMFEEFKIYLYIGAGVALAFGMIIFLVKQFKPKLSGFADKKWTDNSNTPISYARHLEEMSKRWR